MVGGIQTWLIGGGRENWLLLVNNFVKCFKVHDAISKHLRNSGVGVFSETHPDTSGLVMSPCTGLNGEWGSKDVKNKDFERRRVVKNVTGPERQWQRVIDACCRSLFLEVSIHYTLLKACRRSSQGSPNVTRMNVRTDILHICDVFQFQKRLGPTLQNIYKYSDLPKLFSGLSGWPREYGSGIFWFVTADGWNQLLPLLFMDRGTPNAVDGLWNVWLWVWSWPRPS